MSEEKQEMTLAINEAHTVSTNMQIYGGSFVKALGIALVRADQFNILKIKKAFPKYWKQYLNRNKN